MAKAIFYQRGESIDYRPAQAVAAGEVIVQGDLVGITRLDIPAGALGSLAICGVFKVTKKDSVTFNVGDKVYWDASEGNAASSGSVILGLAVAAASAGDSAVIVSLNNPAAFGA